MTHIDQLPPSQALAPVVFAGGVLDPYRHVCAFVNGRDEGRRVLDPFVSDGIDRGERVLFIADPAERASLVSHLRHIGLDMATVLARRQCEIHTWAETYLRGGSFDQDRMLELLGEVLGDSGSPRIRLVSDMGWAATERDIGDLLLEYEARANAVHPKHGHVVICVYDTSMFGGDLMIDVLRTHPMVLIGGVLQVNPFFIPAAEFLEELRSRDRRLPGD